MPWFNASWPLARLDITDTELTIRIRGQLFRWLLGLIWNTTLVLPWAELRRAKLVRSPIPLPGKQGVALYTSDSWVIFWCRMQVRNQIVQLLATKNIQIEEGGISIWASRSGP